MKPITEKFQTAIGDGQRTRNVWSQNQPRRKSLRSIINRSDHSNQLRNQQKYQTMQSNDNFKDSYLSNNEFIQKVKNESIYRRDNLVKKLSNTINRTLKHNPSSQNYILSPKAVFRTVDEGLQTYKTITTTVTGADDKSQRTRDY